MNISFLTSILSTEQNKGILSNPSFELIINILKTLKIFLIATLFLIQKKYSMLTYSILLH